MDILTILPNIEHNLKYAIDLPSTLHTISTNIDVLAPHIDIRLLHCIHERVAGADSSGIGVLLSKIYFIRDDYRNSIAYFDVDHREVSFYYDYMHIKLVEVYLNEREMLGGRILAYVEDIVRRENNIGVIMETRRYADIGMVRDRGTLRMLKKMMETEEFHRLVLRMGLREECRYYIDALVYTELVRDRQVTYVPVTGMGVVAEQRGRQAVQYGDVVAASMSYPHVVGALQEYIASLPRIEQFNASYYVSEMFPQIAGHIQNSATREVLSGRLRRVIYKDFLQRNNRTNLSIFSSVARGIKKSIKVLNLPLIFTNTFLNLCTGNDTFYRKNETFFRGLKGWNKYIGIECFGLIHMFSSGSMGGMSDSDDAEGHPEEAAYRESEDGMCTLISRHPREGLKLIEILQDLLPSSIKSGQITFDYVNSTESAALHALGLAEKEPDFIFNFLDTENFFGSTMGMGNAYYGTHNTVLTAKFLENLKREELHFECFAYAIGQINAASMDQHLLNELENIVRFSEHSRIAYAAAVAMSLIMINDRSFPVYMAIDLDSHDITRSENMAVKEVGDGLDSIREEAREAWNKEHRGNAVLEALLTYVICLTKNQNAYIRLAGTLCLGTLFIKTGNIAVIDRLLNMVKDNSEDVRRAAVLALGMVVEDKNLVSVLNFMVLSHCSFVRSAVALTLGLFLCATGNSEAVDLLEVLLYDLNPLVVQNACIGLGLLLVQCNTTVSNYKRIVTKIDMIILRSGDSSAKFGALIFRGLLNLGGNNLIISYKNAVGGINYRNISNFILFYGFNYFYMLIIYIGLCYQPTVFCRIDIGSLADSAMHYKFVGSLAVDAERKLGMVEDIPLPKRKIRKFRRRGHEEDTGRPATDNDDESSQARRDSTYSIESGQRMTLRERMRTKKDDYSFEFVDDE